MVNAAGIVQDAKIPYCCDQMGKLSSRTIFARAKRMFSIGTRMLRRNPVRTLSCTTKMHQTMVAPMNHRVKTGLARRYLLTGDQAPKPQMNATLTVAAMTTQPA